MDILSRLQEIIRYTGLSVRAFSIKCAINQPTLDKQLKGLRKISIETIMGVLYSMPDISAEWLMRGNGQMLNNAESQNVELERISKLVDTITTLQEAINTKNETISALNERIKQLENQLKK